MRAGTIPYPLNGPYLAPFFSRLSSSATSSSRSYKPSFQAFAGTKFALSIIEVVCGDRRELLRKTMTPFGSSKHRHISVEDHDCFLVVPSGFPSSASPSVAMQESSSDDLLLSPQVRVGETFYWIWHLHHRYVADTPHGPVEYFTSRADVPECKVTGLERGRFTISRYFKVFFNQRRLMSGSYQLVPAQYGHWILNKSPIAIDHGNAYDARGALLDNDPLCRFYSVAEYGVPPRLIGVGTKWTFDRTTMWGPLDYQAQGTTEVTSLDPSTRTVGLRVMVSVRGDSGVNPYIAVMSIAKGGIVVHEVDTSAVTEESAIPRLVGTPSEVDTWNLETR